MIYVEKNTNIPVPKVYDFGENDNGYYILMEKIDGEPLENTWNKLNSNDKEKIKKQLKEYINEMRDHYFLYIGSINNNPFYELFIHDDLVGPFENNSELNIFRINNLSIDKKEEEDFKKYLNNNKDFKTKYILSHNDLGPYNIMVKNNKITGILDWELAGSYPEYWEYNRTIYHNGYDQEWKNIMKDILKKSKPDIKIDNYETVIYYLNIYSNPYCDIDMKNQCKELALKYCY
jgi:thiamine kinase-like enzyme